MVKKSNRRRAPQAKARVNALKSQIRGHKDRVSPDPPNIVTRPWNQVTLVTDNDAVSTAELSTYAIRVLLLSQLSLPAETHFELRVKKVRAWGAISPQNGKPLEIAVFDLSDADEQSSEVLQVITDRGTLARRSSVGYTWPSSQQNQVLITQTNISLVEIVNFQTMYIDVMWRPRTTGSRKSLPQLHEL